MNDACSNQSDTPNTVPVLAFATGPLVLAPGAQKFLSHQTSSRDATQKRTPQRMLNKIGNGSCQPTLHDSPRVPVPTNTYLPTECLKCQKESPSGKTSGYKTLVRNMAGSGNLKAFDITSPHWHPQSRLRQTNTIGHRHSTPPLTPSFSPHAAP
jgi:hypothetical protein